MYEKSNHKDSWQTKKDHSIPPGRLLFSEKISLSWVGFNPTSSYKVAAVPTELPAGWDESLIYKYEARQGNVST